MRVMTKDSESDEEVDTPKQSFISKWFGLSGDETDHTMLSGESEYSSDYSESSYDDESSATDAHFDRKLRAKHTKACKYMRVSLVFRDLVALLRFLVPNF